jgi:Protein of unknown function (DUF3106)
VTWAKGIRILCLGLLGLTAAAQHGGSHFTPQAQSKPHPNPPKENKSNNNGQKGKMGDWLTAHKNLSADEQEKLLENDPGFKSLPPEKQAALRERLRKFNNLTPEQRERLFNRIQFMASLTPEQRQQIREANQTLETLPEDRKILLHKAIRHLSQMTPQEREHAMSEERFKNMFSEQERGILSKLSAINPLPGGAAKPNGSAPQGSEPQTPR